MPASVDAKSRKISSWWIYQEDTGIAALRTLRGTLDSLSLYNNGYAVAPDFVKTCKDALGCEILRFTRFQPSNLTTPAELERAIEQLENSCATGGFDGVDLELSPAFRDADLSSTGQLASRLSAQGKKLSISVGYRHTAPTGPLDQRADGLISVAKLSDEVRVMCYDQNFAPGKGREPFERVNHQSIGPASTQPWAQMILEQWAAIIPAHKLVMGLPAFSNDYEISPNGLGCEIYDQKPPGKDTLIDKSWLWYDKLNVYRYTDERGAPHVFYASDGESTLAHLATAARMEIGAISFWAASSVSEEMWTAALHWRAGGQP